MAHRPIVHLICNAHIDPVWMWNWEEGLRETISTFRSAVTLLDEFPEFIFNHNESLTYEWVEEYDPPLFDRIKALVSSGRWHITGGWYLQPDLNLPGGETLVRVILEGRRYFAEKFGVRPVVSYNFDSFGHPNSIPKLLKQSGFRMYIHCRPLDTQMPLPAPFYRWRSGDGSEIIAVRPDTGWYSTPHPGQAQEQARRGIKIARETGMDTIVTWGLGNHGGGATRADLLLFRDMFREFADSDVEIRHSTPEAFFTRIQPHISRFPVIEGELQRTLSGTYTSVGTIKRQMRTVESLLAMAERTAAMAWWRFGTPYPADLLRAAWKRLMFNSFHDVLCGSLCESAIPGILAMFGFAEDSARRVIAKAQSALLPDIPPSPDTIPIYVLNPHANPVKAPVRLNFLSAYAPPPRRKPFTLVDDRGQVVPHQETGGDSVVIDESTWQPFCGFVAEVAPASVRRYEIRFEAPPEPHMPFQVNESADGITLQTPFFQAHFDRHQAALARLTDTVSSGNLLRAPVRLFSMQDVSHGWGGENRVAFNQPVAPFDALTPEGVGDFVGMEGSRGPALRVIANGEAWITVESLVGWQHCRASIQHTFYAALPYIDMDVRLYMQARRKMIKLQIPLALNKCQVTAEIPYGVAAYPANATEYPYARWLCLQSDSMRIGVANSSQNGFDVSHDGVLNLSISRGGTHCAWSESDVPTEKSYTFMDQTQIDTRFRLLVSGPLTPYFDQALISAAITLNQPLDAFFCYFPPTPLPGAQPAYPPFLHVEPATVVLGALKKADQENALIVRLVESVGQDVTAYIRFEGGRSKPIPFAPYEIKTFKIDREGTWTLVNLIEENI
jgi:alpha-mannosidase